MADTCCEYLNNRVWKNGRIITCVTWDGETKYDYEETEEERQKRIDEWHAFLESDEQNYLDLFLMKILIANNAKINVHKIKNIQIFFQ